MLREIYRSMFLLGAIGIAGAGCLTAEDATGDEPEVAAPLTGAAPMLIKPAPIRPPDRPGVVTDGTLPAKPANTRAQRLAPASAWHVTVTATPSELWPTQFSTVTATSNIDVGATPFYIRILSLGPPGSPTTVVASCGFGTTCTTSVTQPTIALVTYQALIVDIAGNSIPLDDTLGENFVNIDWHRSGVTLAPSAPTVPVGGAVTLTATTAFDVGPSPFYIELFDDTGVWLTSCGTGTTCSTTVTQAAATTHAFKACISGFAMSFPPPNLIECTPLSYVTWSSSGSSVTLTAPALTFGSETVTATASFDVGPTPYFIQIYDRDSGRLTSCGGGTICAMTFTPSTSGSSLIAFVALSSTTLPPPNAQAESPVVLTRREVLR